MNGTWKLSFTLLETNIYHQKILCLVLVSSMTFFQAPRCEKKTQKTLFFRVFLGTKRFSRYLALLVVYYTKQLVSQHASYVRNHSNVPCQKRIPDRLSVVFRTSRCVVVCLTNIFWMIFTLEALEF